MGQENRKPWAFDGAGKHPCYAAPDERSAVVDQPEVEDAKQGAGAMIRFRRARPAAERQAATASPPRRNKTTAAAKRTSQSKDGR
jgi:hypothetical protein